MFQLAMSTFIPPHEVINRFGYLIKGKGTASIIYEIEVFPTRGYKSVELLW